MWLMSTKYNKKETYGQTLVFLKEDGELEEIYLKKVQPFFYTELTEDEMKTEHFLKEEYWDFENNCWDAKKVVSFEEVYKINPITRERVRLTKVSTVAPFHVTNRKGDGMSQFLPNKFVYNNRVKYTDVFMQNTDLIMAMPYKYVGDKLIHLTNKDEIEKHEIFNLPQLKRFDKRVFDWFVPLFVTPFPKLEKHIVAIDIEVDHNMRMIIEPFKAIYPISSIAFKTHEEEICFVLDDTVRGIEEKEDEFDVESKTIVCKNERQLLQKAISYMCGCHQKIVVGFNIDKFDLPYLYNRAKLYGLNDKRFWAYIRKTDGSLVKGIRNKFLVDLYPFFKNPSIKTYAFKNKYDRNSLDSIAQGLLKKEKHKFEGNINALSKYELAYYNLKDVDLTYNLCTFDDEVIMKLAMMFQRMSGLTFETIFRRRVSALIINMLNQHMVMKDMFFPNRLMLEDVGEAKSKALIEGKRYQGARVLPPIQGLHFDVTVLDFASLYPSIMDTKNTCFSTLNCNHESCKSNIVHELGHHICVLRRGLISELVGAIKDIRVYYFKDKKDDNPLFGVVEQALKVYLNASYGIYGDDRLPYFAAPVAESITAEARYALDELVDKAEELGTIVIGGDTDSVFLRTRDKKIIDKLIKFCENTLSLQLGIDYEMRFMTMYKKKNYFGYTVEGDKIVKGLTGKKKNTPTYIRNCFDECVGILKEVNELNKEETIERVLSVVKKRYIGLKKRTMVTNMDDFAISTVMHKNVDDYNNVPMHVGVAKLLYEYVMKKSDNPNVGIRTVVPEGSVIVYVRTIPIGKRKAKPIETVTPNDIDVEEYAVRLLSSLRQLYEPLGIVDEQVMGYNQMKIEEYFN